MADATIRIKLGQIEVDYQGDADFLKKGLLDTVKDLLELQKKHPVAARSTHPKGDAEEGTRTSAGGKLHLSTDTIANELGAKTGTDLVIAAAAYLHFAEDKKTFKRKEIIAEMRTASGIYKSTFDNNMNSYLNTLKVKDRLRLVSAGT